MKGLNTLARHCVAVVTLCRVLHCHGPSLRAVLLVCDMCHWKGTRICFFLLSIRSSRGKKQSQLNQWLMEDSLSVQAGERQ